MEPSLSQCHLHRHHAGPPVAPRRCHTLGRRKLPNSRKPTGSRGAKEKAMNKPVRDSDAESYVGTILSLYQKLPETPTQPSSRDCFCAHQLEQRGVPLDL